MKRTIEASRAKTEALGAWGALVHEIWQADSVRFDTEVRNTEAFRDLERVLEGDFEDVFVEW